MIKFSLLAVAAAAGLWLAAAYFREHPVPIVTALLIGYLVVSLFRAGD